MENTRAKVVIEGEEAIPVARRPEAPPSTLSALVMRLSGGKVTTIAQAQGVLVGVIVMCLALMIIVWVKMATRGVSRPDPDKIIKVAS